MEEKMPALCYSHGQEERGWLRGSVSTNFKSKLESSSCGQKEVKCVSFTKAAGIFESRGKLCLMTYEFLILRA